MPVDDKLQTETLVYSSSRMFERRQRIMDVTLELVAEHGHDGFNMRELCRRAEVAPQTVYKAFESKERLVALSIRQNFQRHSEKQSYHFDAETIEGVIERLAVSDKNIRSVSEFTFALVAIFFSQTAEPELPKAASYHTEATLQPWVYALRQRGSIRKGMAPEKLSSALVYLLFSTAQAWARGEIDGSEFLIRKLQHLLTYASGATRGVGQKEINRYLTDVLGSRELFNQVLEEAGIKGLF
ncbi:MAG: TetR/AcrR family transcriptional regulator [Spongiibacteraceae bacterium]